MKKSSNKQQKIEDLSLQNAIKQPQISHQTLLIIKSQFQNFKSEAIKKFQFLQTFYTSYIKSFAEIQALKKRIHELTDNQQKIHAKKPSSIKTNDKLLAQQIPIDVILSKPHNQNSLKNSIVSQDSDRINCDQKSSQFIKLQTANQFPSNCQQKTKIQELKDLQKNHLIIEFDVSNTSSHFIKIEENIITKLGGFDYTPVFLNIDFSTIQQYSVTILLCQIRNKSSCGVKFGIIDSRTKTLLPSSSQRNFITFKMNTNHVITDIQGKQSKKTFSFSKKAAINSSNAKRDRVKQGDIIRMTVNIESKKLSWSLFSYNQQQMMDQKFEFLQNKQHEFINEINIPQNLISLRNKQKKPIQLIPFVSIYNVGDKVEFINLKTTKKNENKQQPQQYKVINQTQTAIVKDQ